MVSLIKRIRYYNSKKIFRKYLTNAIFREVENNIVKKNKHIPYKNLTVNSFHNYSLKNLPKNFLNISSTNDGSIEIATHKSKKILCLMFHPEREMKSKRLIFNSIKKFFK